MNLFFTPVCQEVNKYKMRLVFIMIKRLRFNRQNSIKQSGFTLVELIVVIVIILVLAAVLVPSVLRYVAKSQEAKCKSGRSTLATEYALAVADGRILWDEKNLDVEELQNGGILSKFACPMDGKIYALRNDDGTVVIRCGYHDDGIRDSGGGSGNSDFPGKNIYDNIVKYIEDNNLAGKNNSDIVEGFYGERLPDDVVSKEPVSKILTDEKIKYLSDELKKIHSSAKIEDIEKALKKFQEENYVVAPYVRKNGEVIMYYTSGNQWDKKGISHDKTSLLYYNGDWYFCSAMNNNYKSLSEQYVLPSLGDANIDVEEILIEKKFIKLS